MRGGEGEDAQHERGHQDTFKGFLRSGNDYGEFSATSKASSEKEKQTFLRSKNVYGELDATNEMRAEKEK